MCVDLKTKPMSHAYHAISCKLVPKRAPQTCSLKLLLVFKVNISKIPVSILCIVRHVDIL